MKVYLLQEIDDYENQLYARVTEMKTRIDRFYERVTQVARDFKELLE